MLPRTICKKIAKSISENPSEWSYKRHDKQNDRFPRLRHKRTKIAVNWTSPLYVHIRFDGEVILKLFGWDTTDIGNSVQGLNSKKGMKAEPLCNMIVDAIRQHFNPEPLGKRLSTEPEPEPEPVPLEKDFIQSVESL